MGDKIVPGGTLIEHFGNGLYALTFLVAAFYLLRWHHEGKIKLHELFTSTDREGTVRTDGRKLFEAGAFFVMTVSFYFLTVSGKMSEWYALIYVGVWVGARTARDLTKISEERASQAPTPKEAER